MSDALERINRLASVKVVDYSDCIDHIDHQLSIDGVNANVRLHYLKFDGNGLPMISALAETLYDYIIHYCIASKNRSEPFDEIQAARLVKNARQLFVHPEATEDDPDQTGEAGEILLYFLVESVLGAPQMVSKMELKTNQNKEINGSDGIHFKWDDQDGIVDIYFGEAKIHQELSGALGSAFKSINDFHDNDMSSHEFLMATKHFKYADEKIKEEIERLIVRGRPSTNVRVNHACLIGYNWNDYAELVRKSPQNILDEFLELYRADAQRVVKLLNNRFDQFDKKHLRFDFFFIPFVRVQDFRDAFNKALN